MPTFRESLRQKNAENVDLFTRTGKCNCSTGRVHGAKYFLGVIGKRMTESFVEDLWIERSIRGSNVATKIISGTHYNREIRAYKLTLQALKRLQWNAFIE